MNENKPLKLSEIDPKKNVPKSQKDKFRKLEQINPELRNFCKEFDLVIKL